MHFFVHYNRDRPGMFDNSVILNLQNFKRDSYISVLCHASECASGRQKSRCGYPPSLARSQNTENGILGIQKRKAVAYAAAYF